MGLPLLWFIRRRGSISRLSCQRICPVLWRGYSSASGVSGVRVRFAPSPTGQLHLGGLRTAIYNFLFSRSQKGKFILRIEDTDQTRLVPGATERLTEMLEWIGVEIDEGPSHGGNYGPYLQSERLPLYWEAIQQLLANGAAYRCFCTERRLELLRKQCTARGETPRYDNRCRHLSTTSTLERINEPHVVRFKLETHTEPWSDLVYGPVVCDVASIEGDPVLMKSDGYPTYHFANVVDDHHMNISHVLRGVEWQVSTMKHILLYHAFGWPPPQYAHLPLLQNREGRKLSKRQSDVNVEHYKNAGYFPEAVVNLLTHMGSGFKVRDTTGLTLTQLVDLFDLAKLNTNSTRVDLDRLAEFNRVHLKRIVSVGQSKQRYALIRQLQEQLLLKAEESKATKDCWSDDYIAQVLDWAKERIVLPSDLLRPDYAFLWFPPSPLDSAHAVHDATLTAADSASSIDKKTPISTDSEQFDPKPTPSSYEDFLRSTALSLAALDPVKFNRDMVGEVLNLACRYGDNRGEYRRRMRLLRRIISGHAEGPAVMEIIVVLGKERTLARLNDTLEQLAVLSTSAAASKMDNKADLEAKVKVDRL